MTNKEIKDAEQLIGDVDNGKAADIMPADRLQEVANGLTAQGFVLPANFGNRATNWEKVRPSPQLADRDQAAVEDMRKAVEKRTGMPCPREWIMDANPNSDGKRMMMLKVGRRFDVDATDQANIQMALIQMMAQ